MKQYTTFLTLAIAGLLSNSVTHAANLVIKGSDTLGAKFVPQLAEAYKSKNPGSTFEIAAEGSTTGISSIIDKTADIGMSSRPAKPTEESSGKAKGVTLTPTIVAHDGIAVIVHASSPLKNLTKKQIEKIFTGDITDWSAVGGKPGKISIYTRNTSSGTYSEFKELAMHKRDYAKSAQKMASNEQIAEEVSKNSSGIGYVGLAYSKAEGVKAVSIDGVALTNENVQNKSYSYARPTFFYTNGTPAGDTKAFIDFTLSDEGQKIGVQVGFIPVK